MRLLPARWRGRARALTVQFWARRILRRGDSVILDTETTDLFGDVCQVSVINLSGQAMLSTLVRPPGPISPAAAAVHGITDADVQDAPQLSDVVDQLLAVTRGRLVLAYNAPYDREVLTRGLRGAGLDPEHLADPGHWSCLMRARARHTGGPWSRLAGPHDALGDCLAALEVLQRLAESPA